MSKIAWLTAASIAAYAAPAAFAAERAAPPNFPVIVRDYTVDLTQWKAANQQACPLVTGWARQSKAESENGSVTANMLTRLKASPDPMARKIVSYCETWAQRSGRVDNELTTLRSQIDQAQAEADETCAAPDGENEDAKNDASVEEVGYQEAFKAACAMAKLKAYGMREINAPQISKLLESVDEISQRLLFTDYFDRDDRTKTVHLRFTIKPKLAFKSEPIVENKDPLTLGFSLSFSKWQAAGDVICSTINTFEREAWSSNPLTKDIAANLLYQFRTAPDPTGHAVINYCHAREAMTFAINATLPQADSKEFLRTFGTAQKAMYAICYPATGDIVAAMQTPACRHAQKKLEPFYKRSNVRSHGPHPDLDNRVEAQHTLFMHYFGNIPDSGASGPRQDVALKFTVDTTFTVSYPGQQPKRLSALEVP